jgi:hypothetical protein
MPPLSAFILLALIIFMIFFLFLVKCLSCILLMYFDYILSLFNKIQLLTKNQEINKM